MLSRQHVRGNLESEMFLQNLRTEKKNFAQHKHIKHPYGGRSHMALQAHHKWKRTLGTQHTGKSMNTVEL